MPAEFGVDPLGIGRRLGLMAISDVKKEVETFQTSRAKGAPGTSTIVPQAPADTSLQNTLAASWHA